MGPSINDLYLKYIDSVGANLEDDRYFQYLFEIVQAGSNELSQTNKILHKVVDEEWLSIIEEAIDSINTIIDKPRRFVTTSEEVVPVALARKISADSVKHLSQHTEFIAASDDGKVHPTRILNVSTEETYDLYENRFIYHLIQRLIAFVDKRTDVIFWSTGDEKESLFTMESKIDDAYENIEYRIEMKVKSKQSYVENDSENMSVFMRIDRVRRLVMALRQSSFCSIMAGCQKVRSPIQRTNLMMKDPHYRKCYSLWQFLERYDSVGYTIDVQESAVEFDEEYLFQMYTNLIMNYTVFKTLTDQDIRDIDSDPVEKHQVIKPKFIKEIKEEFVDDFNLPDVEIRKVYIDEVTKAQIEAEEALEEEKKLRAEAEAEVDRLSIDNDIIGAQLQDAYAQVSSLTSQRDSLEKDLDKALIEKKTEIEAAAQIRYKLESSLKERTTELDNQRTANKLLENKVKEVEDSIESSIAEAESDAAARIEAAETDAATRIEAAESDAATRIEEAESDALTRIEAAVNDAASIIETAQLEAAEAVDRIRRESDELVRKSQDEANEKVSAARTELEEYKREYDEKLTIHRQVAAATADTLKREYEEKLEKQKKQSREALLRHVEETEEALEAREKAFNERYNEYRLEVEGMIKELKSSLKDETEKSAAAAKERDKAAEALSGLEARAASQSAELEKLRKELTELRRSSAETLKRAERAEKERDKARAKADENSLSKYIIDRLSGKK